MRPVSVLLVDDHPIFLRIATTFLETQCKEEVIVVGAAGGGKEALAKAQALRPDIVLIDLAMPGMPGLEAIRRLRAALPEVGLIALTLLDANGYLDAALAAGANGFVSKATMNTNLLPAIRSVMQSKEALRIAST